MVVKKIKRTILHSDLNGFYASVECFSNPTIRNKPVIVGGDAELRHGIVLAKNDLAKKHGIVTGEAVWQAKQKCPNLVSVKPDFEKYLKFSKLAREIYNRFTDQVESFGIDECWCDVTGSIGLFGSGETIANEIRAIIKKELGITASVGVSFNKIFAKLGSDMKKPDATTVITLDNYRSKVWELPAADLLYVGPSTKRKLARIGIQTIGQLVKASPQLLTSILGVWGITLYRFANGMDDSPVAPRGDEAIIKSVGNSSTLPRDVSTVEDVNKTFFMLSESVASRLRDHGLKATTVQVYLRDNELMSCERQAQLKYPTNLTAEISEKAMEIFQKKYFMRKPLRSIGVRGCNLVPKDTAIQLDLFTNHFFRERQERFEYEVDRLRERYGYFIIQRGILLEDRNLTGINPKNHTIHPVSFFDGAISTDYQLKRSG